MMNSPVEIGLAQPPLSLFLVLVSIVVGIVTWWGTAYSFHCLDLPPGRWPLGFGIIGAVLSAALVVSVLQLHSQHTPVVLPSEAGRTLRLLYHLCLLSLLLMVTATDLKSYFILEWTCWLGIGIGLAGAVLSGEFQLVHVWVDWNQEQPQLRGPYIPEWLAVHPHGHGLAWSLCGIAMGVALSWGTKVISRAVLAMPTLGTGDIYLMAMIGAFLGWQPTLIAFAIAPVFALLVGGVVRAVSNQPALPYGPFLALGAIVVLFAWRPIWMSEISLTLDSQPGRDSIFALRRFFGDWLSLAATFLLAGVLFVCLLGLLRLYKSLNVKQ